MKHALTIPVLVGLAKFFSGATVRWVDCQPEPCQRIYFANHTSHLDPLVIWASLPWDLRVLTRPAAARDYWEKGWLRQHIAGAFNAILIDRQEIKVHASPITQILNEIGDKYSLIIFPEGGRSPDGEMHEFKSGLFHLARKRPDVELMPVYLENMNRVLPRGEVFPVPLLTSITIGPPIWLERGETKVDFLVRARNSIVRLRDRS